MTNTNVEVVELYPNGGITNAGYKLGYISAADKAAQNDTWTVKNATNVLMASATLDATGAAEPHTISANVITLTGATGTACSAIILYKE